jgi:hypothetical protein
VGKQPHHKDISPAVANTMHNYPSQIPSIPKIAEALAVVGVVASIVQDFGAKVLHRLNDFRIAVQISESSVNRTQFPSTTSYILLFLRGSL